MNSSITVKELLDLRRAAEESLAFQLREFFQEFKDKTGVGIRRINLRMMDVSTFGDSKPRQEITGVELELDL